MLYLDGWDWTLSCHTCASNLVKSKSPISTKEGRTNDIKRFRSASIFIRHVTTAESQVVIRGSRYAMHFTVMLCGFMQTFDSSFSYKWLTVALAS